MFQIRWIWKNMDEEYRKKYLVGLLISLVTTVMGLINPFLSAELVDEVIVNHNVDPMLRLLITMLVVVCVQQGLRYLMMIWFEGSAQNVVYNMKSRLFENLQHQEMAFFDRHRAGDLMTRLTGDLDWVRHFTTHIVFNLMECFVRFGSTLVFLMFINTKLTLALLAAAPALLVITFVYSKKIRPLFMDLRERSAALNTAAQENIAGNKVVKAFAREEYEKNKFREHNKAFHDANLNINERWLKFYPGIDLLANAMTVITIFFGAFLIMEGELTFGGLSIFTSLSWALSSPMSTLGNYLNDLQRFASSANKVIEIYYARPSIIDRDDAIPHPRADVKGKVEFRNVDFAYGREKVLEDVSFTVEPGKTLAIMGSTGSGKTTIINLLARLYDTKNGAVLVDDCDVHLWRINELRRCIGNATQDVFLFSDTVSSNIAFGNPGLSQEQIADFARRAGAAEFIEKMPEGYETVVGERGVGLSGGQRQRVALARALAMEAPIVVLDDTTSALDSETEQYIREQLNELPYACTKIIVAQRISSVKAADEILVLDKGRIAERGTHDELIALGGLYYETYCLQNDIPYVAADQKGGE
ncbi:MAG: ABC transporter ATP-binding protein [Oscillospiraceae bacterium]|nr:ABC transporter ATP-binding protein [Oscillospiraceae bacterium]